MNGFWSSLYSTTLANQPLVGRIHLVEQLESLAPYSAADSRTYFHRIRDSLKQLPREHHHGALLVFCSVLYYPTTILDDIWRFLWFELNQLRTAGSSEKEFFSELQFFEVDPAGMTNHFAHLNAISGRLDTETYARVGDITSFVQLLRNLSNTDQVLQNYAIEEIRLLARKKTWVILTDKSLSGQSLANDLRRYIELASFLNNESYAKIRIVVLAQIITTDARQYVNQACDLAHNTFVTLIGGSEIDVTCKINSPACRLFGTADERNQVERLCDWFAKTYLVPDLDLDRMREKSGDNMAFGYRGCGLTLCDSANCPTDSLPILWYESDKGNHLHKVPYYKGPYPRTHSRIGGQKRSPIGSKLEEIPNWKETVRMIF